MRAMLSFEVPGAPVPCERVRFANGRMYTPGKTAAYEQRIALLARAAVAAQRWAPPTGASFSLLLNVYREARRGDWDNYAKAIADGLTKGGVWPDDRYVVRATVKLHVDRENPRAHVIVGIASPTEDEGEAA